MAASKTLFKRNEKHKFIYDSYMELFSIAPRIVIALIFFASFFVSVLFLIVLSKVIALPTINSRSTINFQYIAFKRETIVEIAVRAITLWVAYNKNHV